MELPEDDVGVEMMNKRFMEMGILVETDDGYQVNPEFLERIHTAAIQRAGDVEVTSGEYRNAILEELKTMGVPAGFEEVLTNWVVHAKRIEEWD